MFHQQGDGVFAISSFAIANNLMRTNIVQIMRQIHTKLIVGDNAGYHEIRIGIPAALRSQRTAKVILYLIKLNIDLKGSN